MFIAPLMNLHLLGEAQNLRPYSSVNQAIHTVSTIAKCSLSIGSPFSSFPCSWGMVFKVKAMVEITMKRVDMVYGGKAMSMSSEVKIGILVFQLQKDLVILLHMLRRIFHFRIVQQIGNGSGKLKKGVVKLMPIKV